MSTVETGSKPKKKPVSHEIRYAMHLPRNEDREDTHYVKLQVTYDDGTREPRIAVLKNFKRPVYVTAPAYRNHVDKKEFEHIDKLIQSEATESDVDMVYANLLEQPHLAGNPRRLNESQNVYAKNLKATNFIKLKSLEANNFIQTPYTVAGLDLETNVFMNTPDIPYGDIITGTIAKILPDGKYEVFTVINSLWLKQADMTTQDIERQCEERLSKFAPKDKKGNIIGKFSDNVKTNFIYFDNQIDICRVLFKVANEWACDWLSIWNMMFDIHDTILRILNRHKVDPREIFCDSGLPMSLRRFEFVPGPDVKVTSDGKSSSIPPSDQWHKVYNTAKYHIVDSMCTFRSLRVHEGLLPRYSLDFVLGVVLGSNKLKVEGTDRMSGMEWHRHMQSVMKPTYVVYNIADVLEMLELERKTKDLANSIPTYSGITDFNDFKGSEAKTYASLYIYAKEKGWIIGTGANMERVHKNLANDEEFDNSDAYRYATLGIKDWIQTLPIANVMPMGLRICLDFPDLITNARGNNKDSDAISSYPIGIMTLNISKATCYNEIISIGDIPEVTFRAMTLAVLPGNANTIEFCEVMHDLYGMDELLLAIRAGEFDDIFNEEINEAEHVEVVN